MTNIKCMVEECKYNDNYFCEAGEICIKSCDGRRVNCCEQTACETFDKRK